MLFQRSPFFISKSYWFLIKNLLFFFRSLHLRHEGIESQVEAFFECFALVLYEVGMFGYMYFYFSYFISYLLRFIVEFQIDFEPDDLIVESLELFNFRVYMFQ